MTRRQFGRINKLPSGRFRIRYSVNGRVVSGGTYPTKAAARDALAAARTDIRRGEWADPACGNVTFAEAMAAYITYRTDTVGRLSATTAHGYRSIAANHLNVTPGGVSGFGVRKVREITRSDVNALVAAIGRKSLAPQSTRNVIRLVSAVLAYAQREEGWITTNPAERVTMPTVRRGEMGCISEAEVMTLAASFEDPARQTMIRLTVFGGGLRAGEVAGLIVADFDPAASSITVARARRRGDYVDTKTEAGRRTNVLPGWLAADVAELCTGRADDEPMFLSPDGAAHDHGNFMRRTFGPTVMRAGLPRSFRFHDLRHTAASLALAKGVPVVDVARWLGHANPTTTLSIYGHVIPDQRGRPAAAFENVARPALRAVS